MTSQSDTVTVPIGSVSLLVIDDEPAILELCEIIASAIGLKVYSANSAREGLVLMESVPIDVVLTDLCMPGLSGIELVQRLRRMAPDIRVIMMSGCGSIETAVEAMQCGTSDFLCKPFSLTELRTRLVRVAEECIANSKAQRVRNEFDKIGGLSLFVGRSSEMQRIYRIVTRAANSTTPVLILGEDGTGKELLARSIHLASKHCREPFIPIDCCSLLPDTLESELFGHMDGAFQGAARAKQALLASAQCGTVLFNELGHLSLQTQAKLARVLQEKVIRPFGERKTLPFRARIIATSSMDLAAAVDLGRFRQDLFYRLNVLTVRLPPLRAHKEDIPLIVRQYLETMSNEHGSRRSISQDAVRELVSRDWPGNITQLETVLEQACISAGGSTITRSDLTALDRKG